MKARLEQRQLLLEVNNDRSELDLGNERKSKCSREDTREEWNKRQLDDKTYQSEVGVNIWWHLDGVEQRLFVLLGPHATSTYRGAPNGWRPRHYTTD
jgi:hypothetical protein